MQKYKPKGLYTMQTNIIIEVIDMKDCKDCTWCKVETINEGYCYCEWFNDYFLKSDSNWTCEQWEVK